MAGNDCHPHHGNALIYNMVYLHQRIAQDTQGKSRATSKPEDEAENSPKNVNETLPITLHATIISVDYHFFFFLLK